LLLKLERTNARIFYLEEAIACQWSTRTLERQINCLYFERMALSRETVEAFGNDPKHLGAQMGMVSLLHTWGQNLSLHPHVHIILMFISI